MLYRSIAGRDASASLSTGSTQSHLPVKNYPGIAYVQAFRSSQVLRGDQCVILSGDT